MSSFLEAREAAPTVRYRDARRRARELHAGPPEVGRGFEGALELFGSGVGYGYELTSPGFMAYVPGGGLMLSAVAALLASVTNPFVGHADGSPTMAALELSVLRWLCSELGLPADTASGVFTSGGSMSALTAVVAARTARLGDDLTRGRIYISDDAHGSLAKAVRAAGFPLQAIRRVQVDAARRLDVGALTAQIEADRRRGDVPFLVVATAGTTNTGAIDPLADVAAVAEEKGLWMHVDGCYGGLFQLTTRGKQAFAGIEAADSVALDPHKALSLPAGCGCLLVRDAGALDEAFASKHEHAYLQDAASGVDGMVDFADHSLELTRPFRGLQLWLPLQALGVGAFRQLLDEKLDLARELGGVIEESPALELPWPVELSLVAFRPRSEILGDAERANSAARELLKRINASERVFLSSTTIDERVALRACILTHRTRRDRVTEAGSIITHFAAQVAELGSAPLLRVA